MRVFFDTNALVSAFATRGLCADLLHAVLAEHRLILGEAVLAEVRRVLRLKLGLTPALVEEVEALLREQAVIVTDAPRLEVDIRDPADLVILSEAVAGEADVLVTGDRDLLDTAAESPVPVVTPRGLWEKLRTE
ncbi:MAG TPA: putative toxin-antitoxin system toxin component, PIN family [Gemmatimonadales bacterium]|nr:putative toxin-antitoxin system toxin component, PIN family [Gemmatimonadales bacterium]